MRPRVRRENWQAFGSALSLEAIALGGILSWWALHPATPPLQVLPLEIEAPAPVLEPLPPAPPPTPAPTPQPRTHQRMTPPPALPPVAPAPAPAMPAPATAPAPPQVTPSVSPTPTVLSPPPAPAPVAPPGPSAEYIAKVRAAVQAAFVYPLAAKAIGFQGRTRVAFTLHGVVPVGARVLVGCGMGLVDRAALKSVEVASYPTAPAEMKGADASFVVWVEFKP